MLFVIPAFGAVVSWEGDGSPFKESYDVITHQVKIQQPLKHAQSVEFVLHKLSLTCFPTSIHEEISTVPSYIYFELGKFYWSMSMS